MTAISKNECFICGLVEREPEPYMEIRGEKFYMTTVRVRRRSNSSDTVPVRVSERADGFPNIRAGEFLYIKGSLRSYNEQDGERLHLRLYLFAEFIYPVDEGQIGEGSTNSFEFSGTICKKPLARVTPRGHRVTDVMLAVNGTMRSYYIPCIAFGRNASHIGRLPVGTVLDVAARFQSRNYLLRGADGDETRTTYELAVAAYTVREAGA